MSGTSDSADLLMQHRCLTCGHLWRKSSAADHDNCPECKSPNWASADTLERAQRLDPIEEQERGKRERDDAKARIELPQCVTSLLGKHGLTVPVGTTEMIIKTIAKCRWLKSRTKKQKGKELSPRERLKVARTHATKLLKYANTGSSHANSVAKRSESLRKALEDVDAVIWLAVANPPVDVPELLNEQVLDSDALTRLIRSLDAALSTKNGARTGRPVGKLSRIVCAGCITWIRAGRKRGYRWDHVTAALLGPLPEFIRDLLSLCAGSNMRLRPTDVPLHTALKDCKSDLAQRDR